MTRQYTHRGFGWLLALGLLAVWVGWVPQQAQAQTETLLLSIRRNFGYRSGNDIQGSMHLEVAGPSNVVSVTYTLDGELLGMGGTSPTFGFDFNTDDYPLGAHTLQAQGQTATGQTLVSEELQLNFLGAGDVTQKIEDSVRQFVWPILGVVGMIIFIAFGVVLLSARQGLRQLPPGSARKYGLQGGAICPKCHRPFPLHWWAFNAGFHKYDRCEFCGRWSLVKAVSSAELAAAEKAEVTAAEAAESAPNQTGPSEAEKLRALIEASKYES